MINLRDQEQIGEDFMFFKRFQAPRRWTVEEARHMLDRHKAGELYIGQMLEPYTERNTSAETIKVRMVTPLCNISWSHLVTPTWASLVNGTREQRTCRHAMSYGLKVEMLISQQLHRTKLSIASILTSPRSLNLVKVPHCFAWHRRR